MNLFQLNLQLNLFHQLNQLFKRQRDERNAQRKNASAKSSD